MPTTRLYPESDVTNTWVLGDWSDIDEDIGSIDTSDYTRSVTSNQVHNVELTAPAQDIRITNTIRVLLSFYGLTTQVATGLRVRVYSGTTLMATQDISVDNGGTNTTGAITFVLALDQAEVNALRIEYENIPSGNAPDPEPEI